MPDAAAAPAPTSTTPTSEAKAPETKAPETKAPATETKAPETKAPETQKESDLLTGDDAPKTDAKTDSPASAAEIEIKVPEGVEVDKAMIDAFKPLAKELGLDSPKAQKLVDFQIKAMAEAYKQTDSAWNAQKQQWRETAAKDPEIGGAKFKENVDLARKAMDKFGGKEFKAELARLGLGNHPEMIRFMYRVGKAISEDTASPLKTRPAGAAGDREAMLREAFPSMYRDEK
jgi:hypothetical protein